MTARGHGRGDEASEERSDDRRAALRAGRALVLIGLVAHVVEAWLAVPLVASLPVFALAAFAWLLLRRDHARLGALAAIAAALTTFAVRGPAGAFSAALLFTGGVLAAWSDLRRRPSR